MPSCDIDITEPLFPGELTINKAQPGFPHLLPFHNMPYTSFCITSLPICLEWLKMYPKILTTSFITRKNIFLEKKEEASIIQVPMPYTHSNERVYTGTVLIISVRCVRAGTSRANFGYKGASLFVYRTHYIHSSGGGFYSFVNFSVRYDLCCRGTS